MGNHGIKTSKDGFDALEESDIENMSFTSAKGALGWRFTQTVSDTTDANGKIEAEYAHNLGYVPFVFVYVTNYDGEKIAVPSQWESDWPADETLEENFYFYVDSSKVYVKAYVHHYEPIMGGDDTNLSNQDYDFEVIIYYNEIINEE